MRVIEPHTGSGSRSEAVKCEAPGCSANTREGKPYCSEHVDFNPYVSRLLSAIEKRDEEDDVVREGRTPVSRYNIDGITAREIIQHLSEHGPRTRERLCKDLQLDGAVLDGYAKALIRKKIVRQGRTRRGSMTLELRASA